VIPIYLTISEVSKLLDWQPKRTRRWLKRANCLVERAGRQVTSVERLKAEFPEVYDEIATREIDSLTDGAE